MEKIKTKKKSCVWPSSCVTPADAPTYLTERYRTTRAQALNLFVYFLKGVWSLFWTPNGVPSIYFVFARVWHAVSASRVVNAFFFTAVWFSRARHKKYPQFPNLINMAFVHFFLNDNQTMQCGCVEHIIYYIHTYYTNNTQVMLYCCLLLCALIIHPIMASAERGSTTESTNNILPLLCEVRVLV